MQAFYSDRDIERLNLCEGSNQRNDCIVDCFSDARCIRIIDEIVFLKYQPLSVLIGPRKHISHVFGAPAKPVEFPNNYLVILGYLFRLREPRPDTGPGERR